MKYVLSRMMAAVVLMVLLLPVAPSRVAGSSELVGWDCTYDVDWSLPEDATCPWSVAPRGITGWDIPNRQITYGGDWLNFTPVSCTGYACSGDFAYKWGLSSMTAGVMFEAAWIAYSLGLSSTNHQVLGLNISGTTDGWLTYDYVTVTVGLDGDLATDLNLTVSGGSEGGESFSQTFEGFEMGKLYKTRLALQNGLLQVTNNEVLLGQFTVAWDAEPSQYMVEMLDGDSGTMTMTQAVLLLDYWGYKLSIEDPSDVDPTPLPHVIRTRGDVSVDLRGVDPSYYFWYDVWDTDAALPAAFQQAYVLGEASYYVEEDVLYVPKYDTDRLWINDTQSTATTSDDINLLNTTSAIAVLDLRSLSAVTDGENITVTKPGGTAYRSDRDSTVRVARSFTWTNTDPTRKLWTYTLVLNNNLTRDWENVEVVIPLEPDVVADPASIGVWDIINNQALTRGQHFTFDTSSIRFGLDIVASGQNRGFRLSFTEYAEGTHILEPNCMINGNPGTETFQGRQYNHVEFTCSNANQFEYSGRVVLFFTGLSKKVDPASVIVSDANGKAYAQITPLGGQTVAVYGLTFDAYAAVTLDAYFYYEAEPFSANWFRTLAPWMAIAEIVLMAVFANRLMKVNDERRIYIYRFALGMSDLLLVLTVVLGFVL